MTWEGSLYCFANFGHQQEFDKPCEAGESSQRHPDLAAGRTALVIGEERYGAAYSGAALL
jgi:hypothetical protein